MCLSIILNQIFVQTQLLLLKASIERGCQTKFLSPKEWQNIFILIRQFQLKCKLEKAVCSCDSLPVLESGPEGVEKEEIIRML